MTKDRREERLTELLTKADRIKELLTNNRYKQYKHGHAAIKRAKTELKHCIRGIKIHAGKLEYAPEEIEISIYDYVEACK